MIDMFRHRLLLLAAFAVLLALTATLIVSCLCDSKKDSDDDNDTSHSRDDDDTAIEDDDDTTPPADCEIIHCAQPEWANFPHRRTGTCFPDECFVEPDNWLDDCYHYVLPTCLDAVVLDGRMWARCSTDHTMHFCAVCNAEGLEFCGYDAWRLPILEEALSLYDPSQPPETPPWYETPIHIRRPFELKNYRIWLSVNEDATVDDFGGVFDYSINGWETLSPTGCRPVALFVRDLTDGDTGEKPND